MQKTPDEVVTEKIITDLAERQLVPEAKLKDLAEKLSSGTLSAQDWRLLIELAIESDKEVTHGKEN